MADVHISVSVRPARPIQALEGGGKVEGRDFVYVEIPRETHNLLLESTRLRVLQEMKKFLDKHNPAT